MNKAAFLDRDGVINPKAPEGGYTPGGKISIFSPAWSGGHARY